MGNDSIRYEAEVRATVSGGENTPFWLANNLHGLGSPEKNSGYVRAGAFKDPVADKRFSWGAGIDLVGAWHNTAPFYLHQLYGEIKYRSIGAMIGSKEMQGVINNPQLSSGNLLYSGNAAPIPQLRAGIFDYADFWGTRGWLGVKGYIAYGLFTDSGWQKSWAKPDSKRTEDVLYHSKGLWLRVGKPETFPLQGEIGIEMATQFGGKSYEDGKVINNGHGIKDWFDAFIPHSEKNPSLSGEVTSVKGNMLGAYDFALSWLPDNGWSVKAYYEHYFEDHSQMTFEYGWKDGLWGFEVNLPENNIVSSLVYEYIYTKDQSGAVNNDYTPEVPEQVSGRDNYFNHSLYSGWQHHGMGIGSPLIISPLYNHCHEIYFHTARIISHHLGIAGNPMSEISYRLLLTYSKNWGTYFKPLPEVKENFNGLLEVSWKPRRFKGWGASLGIAGDTGRMLGKSLGMALTISKTGWFGLKKKQK